MTVSTHVLDTMAGRPAAGVAVSLSRLDPDGGPCPWVQLAAGETDADGRHRFGDPAGVPGAPGAPEPGVYRLTFGTGGYFAGLGVPAFYPEVTITFSVSGAGAHYHVPLLLSPFGYSTYRGS
jgi:5-hydroxyisourate hydrolase